MGFMGFADSKISIKNNTFIHDDEVINVLKRYAEDLFRIMRIKSTPHIYLVLSDDINAAATYGGRILMHTETILQSDSVEELLSVLAHEAAHIKGSHLVRQRAAMEKDILPMIGAALLGAAAAIGSGQGEGAIGGLALGSHLSTSYFLKHSRELETMADAEALKALNKMGVSGQYLTKFLKKLKEYDGHPYFTTHPGQKKRIINIKLLRDNPVSGKSLDAYQSSFKRIKAKLMAYTNPDKALRVYKGKGLVKQYAQSIALFQKMHYKKAALLCEKLVKKEPKNPYFFEFLGQIYSYLNRRKDAVRAYQQAHDLSPKNPGISCTLANLLIQEKQFERAQKVLEPLKFTEYFHNPFYLTLWMKIFNHQNKKECLKIAQAYMQYVRGERHRSLSTAQKSGHCSIPFWTEKRAFLLSR